MDLNHINYIKNVFEPLFFGKIINKDFNNENIAKDYIRVLDRFLEDTLNFKENDIDAVQIYKRRIGWYQRVDNNRHIANDLNKHMHRIDHVYDKSVKKLKHPLIQAKLIKMLVNYLYSAHNKSFTKNEVNWLILDKLTKNYEEFVYDERLFIFEKINA